MGRHTAIRAIDLLDWYDRHARTMPWRIGPAARAGGTVPDPYFVWLSEIMLQQTTVATVGDYFPRFTAAWPTVADLAAADLDQVLQAWAGLGYYARARNLHKCARIVSGELGGRFPDTEEALMALPGIGPYTAAVIAAIAFDRPATVVDGNVERVIARLRRIETPLPGAKPEIGAAAAALTPDLRPGDYAQAIMDLGATICTPRNPACALCPWQKGCAAQAASVQADLPRKAPKKSKPVRRGVVFWLNRSDGAVLLRRRPEKGLLGGMMEFPSTPWETMLPADPERHAPVAANWVPLPGLVRHTFTHFHLELEVLTGGVAEAVEGVWAHGPNFDDLALPTLMKKVAAHVEAQRP